MVRYTGACIYIGKIPGCNSVKNTNLKISKVATLPIKKSTHLILSISGVSRISLKEQEIDFDLLCLWVH